MPSVDLNNSTYPREGGFLTTRWSRVVLAGEADGDAERAHEALAGLCRDYWRPLFFFARRRGHPLEDAQDLTQGFLMQMLEKNTVSSADRERGRFRTFLIAAFCNYLANQQRSQMAQKRGGDFHFVSLEDLTPGMEVAQEHVSPELEYEQRWAFALLERVMTRLRATYDDAGRGSLFEVLHPFLSGNGGQRPGYDRISAELGISENAVGIAMHRMRKHYGKILREEIAATVNDPAEVDDELRHLIEVVSGTGRPLT